MTFTPLRQLPDRAGWGPQDVLIIFGELFSRGYVNGLVDEARRRQMKIIFSTMGRRDDNNLLRPLNNEELSGKEQPLINIPLEAGFDLEPDAEGISPVDQLQGIKLSEWENARVDLKMVEQSRLRGAENFRQRVSQYLKEVAAHIPDGANVLFAHTMAGGVPRAKIVMPAMNRIFKGHGERFASSEQFWQSDMGKLCDISFMEVSARTFEHLIELSAGLREKIEGKGGCVRYVAYGYHGTEVLVNNQYKWQSYSPYLQGFAKKGLEAIATRAMRSGIKASVYNAPEILTNSSSVFLGVEVSLYPLLGALRKEAPENAACREITQACLGLMKPGFGVETILDFANHYFTQPVIEKWSDFAAWPQHNGPEQMAAMRTASTYLIDLHQDPKRLMTAVLSEVVFKACGRIILDQAWEPENPVWWLGHDIVAKQTAQ